MKCKALAEKLNADSVIFYGRKPLEEMPGFYRSADAMLVTLLDDTVISQTLPGKVQTYMAAGKPVIAAAGGATATVIAEANCGFCSVAEDFNGLASRVREFCCLENEKRAEMGKNAENFYKENFTKEVFFEKLESFLR